MSVCIQIEKDDKRMCVYSERDFEYMVKKGWKKYVAPAPAPAPDPEPVIAATVKPKKRGRPSKVEH